MLMGVYWKVVFVSARFIMADLIPDQSYPLQRYRKVNVHNPEMIRVSFFLAHVSWWNETETVLKSFGAFWSEESSCATLVPTVTHFTSSIHFSRLSIPLTLTCQWHSQWHPLARGTNPVLSLARR